MSATTPEYTGNVRIGKIYKPASSNSIIEVISDPKFKTVEDTDIGYWIVAVSIRNPLFVSKSINIAVAELNNMELLSETGERVSKGYIYRNKIDNHMIIVTSDSYSVQDIPYVNFRDYRSDQEYVEEKGRSFSNGITCSEIKDKYHVVGIEKLSEGIKPKDLSFNLQAYWNAPSDVNNTDPSSLGYIWNDKPHRLLYDLISKIAFDAERIKELEDKLILRI